MADKFYEKMPKKDVGKYQALFHEILGLVDIKNLTNRSLGREYDQKQIDTDYEKIGLVLDKAEQHGLQPLALQIMFEQYVYADEWQRDMKKGIWVETVIHRKDEDFFPDPWSIMDVYDIDVGQK